MHVLRRRILSSASLGILYAAVASLAATPPALADDQSAQASDKSDQLDTVIVTANKRAEDIKDVPVSISVLGGNDLSDQHIASYDDVTRDVPGLSFSAGGAAGPGVGSETLSIRGVSSVVGAATVGLYLDDAPLTTLNQSGTVQPDFLDIDRVEVLRGPQGTLYGASSEGGTLRFITKKPDLDEYSADVSTDLSGTGNGGSVNYDEKGILNIPIVEGVLAIRVAAEYGDQSGWINKYNHASSDSPLIAGQVSALAKSSGNPAVVLDPIVAYMTATTLKTAGANDVRNEAFRFTALYKATDDLTITPSFYYQRQKQSDSPNYILGGGIGSGIYANLTGGGEFTNTAPTAEWARDTLIVPSLTIDNKFDFATLTSVSSFVVRDYDRSDDGTFYDPDVVVPFYLDYGPFTAKELAEADKTLGTLPNTSQNRERNYIPTEELRFTSPSPQESGLPIKWVAGVYFSNDTDDYNHYEQAPGWTKDFQSIFGYNPNDNYIPAGVPGAGSVNPISAFGQGAPTDPTLWNGDKFDYYISERGVRDYAAFGQVDFDILKDLHGTVGMRYQISQLTYKVDEGGWWNLGIPTHSSSDTSNYAVTPKFSVTYDLSENANIYATIAKGYRDGGANDPVPPGLCGPYYKQLGITAEPQSYGADKLWSYELGTKSRLLDNTLSIDADAYDIQWNNVQQQIVIPVCYFDYISNVGNANAYGAELTMRYKVRAIPGLTLSVAADAQHAVITSSNDPSAAAVGQKLLFTPDWTATLGISYATSINEAMSAFIRLDNEWTGRSNGDFERNAEDYSNKQYGVLNGSIGIQADDYEVSLYAKNMTDNLVIIKQPIVSGVTDAYTLTPVTVGILATKHFAEPHAPEAAMPTVAPTPEAPPPAPVVKAPEAQREFQVFFDFDKSDITDAASQGHPGRFRCGQGRQRRQDHRHGPYRHGGFGQVQPGPLRAARRRGQGRAGLGRRRGRRDHHARRRQDGPLGPDGGRRARAAEPPGGNRPAVRHGG
jgi:iron complex outermembrane receptor protein